MSRRRALSVSFPNVWREMLAERVSWYSSLNECQQATMEDLVRLFLDKTRFEGVGIEVTDEIRAVIAYEACLLVLGLGIEWYRDVTSVIVYPSTVIREGAHGIGDGIVDGAATPLLGEARLHGPVVVVWDMASRQAHHPERGHNVVLHEFAHKLDMYDGVANGIPALRKQDRAEWERTVGQTLQALRERPVPPLDPYGATNPAEFFAVATEAFFEMPVELRESLPSLYGILSRFYGQDPALRHDR
ncbi:MAG: M90 family metallopeptidase [Acidimicrobiia bacterium]